MFEGGSDMVDVQSRAQDTQIDDRPRTKKNDRRELIPELGLTEYWYPAIADAKVKNKPDGLVMLGEQLDFFRG